MVAQALGAGAGALLCAGPQALVCGAVGAAIVTGVLVGAWWMSSSSVENADEKAAAQLESGTVAATYAQPATARLRRSVKNWGIVLRTHFGS
jgi:ABC-type branched-subunit amino acid transport system substrate-binding protein